MSETKPAVPIENGIIQVNSLEGAYRYAQYVLASGLAPSGFKNAEAILIAMQMGAELGLRPMQSLQNIAVINGKAGIYGKALPGIVMQTGALEKFEEWWEGDGDTLVACCRVKRKGVAEERVEKFSVADAKLAGLWNKKTSTGGPTPWTLYPKDMLRTKARSRAFVIFSDILCGLYAVEELRDIPADAPASDFDGGKNACVDPLLKSVTGQVVVSEASGVINTTQPTELDGRAFLEAEQKKNDAALTEKQKEMAAKGKKKKSAPVETGTVEPSPKDSPSGSEAQPEYVCKACRDTGKNSKGAPCVICQKPDKASGDPFKKESADPNLVELESTHKDSDGKSLDVVRELVNKGWRLLTEEQQLASLRGMGLDSPADLKPLNVLQLRKFIEEMITVYRAG